MTPTGMSAQHRAALYCAARGWPVFPLRPGDKRPSGHAETRCPGTGRCSSGHLIPEARATTDPDLITRAWVQRPYNVGLATGPANLVVIDLDTPKGPEDTPPPVWAGDGITDGMDVLAVLCERHGQPWPGGTYTVRTARGGLHLYFTAPAEKQLRSSGGKLGWKVDIRAWGGYVVAAGSTIADRPYVIEQDAPPAPLPAWLGDLITPPPAPRPTARTVVARRVTRAPAYATAALHGELEKVLTTAKGGRNRAVYMAAYALARLIGDGLSEQEITDALTDAGVSLGLSPAECRTAVRSGLTRGAHRPPRTARLAQPPGPVGESKGSRPKAVLPASLFDGSRAAA